MLMTRAARWDGEPGDVVVAARPRRAQNRCGPQAQAAAPDASSRSALPARDRDRRHAVADRLEVSPPCVATAREPRVVWRSSNSAQARSPTLRRAGRSDDIGEQVRREHAARDRRRGGAGHELLDHARDISGSSARAAGRCRESRDRSPAGSARRTRGPPGRWDAASRGYRTSVGAWTSGSASRHVARQRQAQQALAWRGRGRGLDVAPQQRRGDAGRAPTPAPGLERSDPAIEAAPAASVIFRDTRAAHRASPRAVGASAISDATRSGWVAASTASERAPSSAADQRPGARRRRRPSPPARRRRAPRASGRRVTGSETPESRRSKRITRANRPSRSNSALASGSVHEVSTFDAVEPL